jgi:hypothetical protein
MDGNYRKNVHMSIIQNWIKESFIDDKWKDFYDLHLDEIDSKFIDNKLWVIGGLQCLDIAKEILSDSVFFPILSFELSSENLFNLKINNQKELIDIFSFSPPSLYVMNNDFDNWQETIYESVQLFDIDLFIGYKIYYREIVNDDSEFDRFLYII